MTEKELTSVRKMFVDKATKELIEQLLDDLLDCGVLQNGHKGSILEESKDTAAKARRLIDTVRNIGDEACSRMIAHLHNRDPKLCSTLGLSSSQPAQPAVEPQMEQEWSTTLTRTTEAFWREKLNDRDTYHAARNSIQNRVALLITNIKFANEQLNRNGAERDEENMEKLLTGLGYEVVKHTNLTGKAIDDAVIAFSKHPKLKETDSVLVVIMSHGILGAVLGVNWRNDFSENPDMFPINNIYKRLGSEGCPALFDKPKIIIIQACRGEENGSVLISDGANPDVVCDVVAPGDDDYIEDDTLRCVHKEKDFISLLSCTPDTVSYRQRQRGSFLIQYIVDVFNTFAHKDDIEKLFKRVMRRFEDFSIQTRRQMPTKDRCTLTKDFHFFPGI